MELFRARYVYPVSAPAIEDGVVAVEGERIVGVGEAREMVTRYVGVQVHDLGDVMLMPQAVNVHTHLELGALAEMGRRRDESHSFVAWIMELAVNWRRVPVEVQVEGAREGCRMLLESGTAAVGDISARHHSLEPLLESGLYGIMYHEVLDQDPANAEVLLQSAQECIGHWRKEYGEHRIRFGVTLHTPLTVSAEAFRLFLPWVIEEQVPLCIHAAESAAERDYLLFNAGEVAALPTFAFRHDWIPSPGCSPVRYLEQLGVLKAGPLLVHGVQVDKSDVRLLAAQQVSMAHCPRSNAWLNCGRMPIEDYLETGAPLAMGTDSLASSPSLSVWEEAVSAMQLHRAAGVELGTQALLRLCTLDGARVLGCADVLGSLEPGKLAKFAVGRRRGVERGERQGRDQSRLYEKADEMLGLLWDGGVEVKGLGGDSAS